MPLFNWDSKDDGPRTKEGFKLYWAIAIPLTVGVLGIWILSMAFPWIEWLTKLVTRKRKRPRESSSQLGEEKGDAA